MQPAQRIPHLFRFLPSPSRPAAQVTLRGDFVDWFKRLELSRAADGSFELELDLAPGVYAYKFQLDGGDYVTDPGNPRTESPSAAHLNSLLVVGGTEEPIVHAPARPFLFLDDLGRLVVRARLRRGAGTGLDLLIACAEGEARVPLEPRGGDAQHLDFEGSFPGGLPEQGLRYLFQVTGEGALAGVRCGQGSPVVPFDLAAEDVPRLPAPRLAGKSIYRVVLDRFRSSRGALPGSVSNAVEARAGGDLRGVIEALPHLADLGVDALLLTPLGNARSYHRYDLFEPLALDPDLGGEEDLRELIERAHARGLKVLLDCAISHVNPSFFAWMDVVENGERSRFASWFFIHRFPVVIDRKDPAFRHYPDGPHLPLLNTEHPEVLALLEEYVRRWTAAGIDGWRLDAVADVPRPVFERLAAAARSVNPDASFFSELVPDGSARYLGRPSEVVSDFGASNAALSFFLQRQLRAEDFSAQLAARSFRFGADAERMLLHLADLDQIRPLTLSGSPELVRLGALFLATVPATPLVLYGDEVGLTCGTAGRFEQGLDRVPMSWNEGSWDRSTLAAFGEVFWLRAEQPIAGGSFAVTHARGGALAWARRDSREEALCAANVWDEPARIPLDPGADGRFLLRLGEAEVRDGALWLGPRSGAVLARPLPEASPADPAEKNLARVDRAFRRGTTGRALPTRWYLNLTERCNLRCAHCITCAPEKTADRTARDMDPRVLERLAPLLEKALYVGFVHAGEPTVSPLLVPALELLRQARKGKPAVVHLLSNGMTLSAARFVNLARLGVRSLSISMDGASAATNDLLRIGSRYERLAALFPELVRARREERLDCRLGVAFTVSRSNVHEVGEAVRCVARAGFDWFKLEEMYPMNDRSRAEAEIAPGALRRALGEARAAARETGILLLEHLESPAVRKCRLAGDPAMCRFSLGDDFVNRMEINSCRLPFELACVEPDGAVKPLSFHHPSAGNLLERDFREIWESRLFRAVREQSMRERVCGAEGATCPADPGPEGW